MTTPAPTTPRPVGALLGVGFVVLAGALVLGLMVRALLVLVVFAGLGLLLLVLGLVYRARRTA
jgi:hypothetical protein